MKNALIGSLVAIGVLALVAFLYIQLQAVTERAARISGDVITRYVSLLESADYEQAWQTCLDPRYQAKTPLAAFVQAHAARVASFGALEGFEEKDFQHEANLFSSESLIGFNGILHYANRDVFVTYKVDSAIEPFRILETIGGAERSDFLSSGVW